MHNSVYCYICIYAECLSLYIHILGFENIFIDHLYMFSGFICLFTYLSDAVYVQIGANECKCMLHCTSMLPQMRRVAFDFVQQS